MGGGGCLDEDRPTDRTDMVNLKVHCVVLGKTFLSEKNDLFFFFPK